MHKNIPTNKSRESKACEREHLREQEDGGGGQLEFNFSNAQRTRRTILHHCHHNKKECLRDNRNGRKMLMRAEVREIEKDAANKNGE